MGTTLTTLSQALASAVEQSAHSLIQIRTRRRVAATGIVWSSNGLIVTAAHVIHHAAPVLIGLPDGTVDRATVVGRDETTDIALLRTEADGLSEPTWRDDAGLRVGDLVLAVGRPGNGPRAGFGIVSHLDGAWTTRGGGRVDRYIECDASAFPGFSGGPLVHADGGFIGMNTGTLLRGIGATIPYSTLARVVGALKEFGRIRRGYLGISSYPVTIGGKAEQEMGQSSGLVVCGVEPESPAEAGGMLLGDVLLRIGTVELDGPESLRASLSEETIGQEMEIALLRGGTPTTIRITVGERLS